MVSRPLFKRRCCPECGTVTASEDITVTRGNLTLDRALRRATWRGQQVRLTPQQIDILELLVQREGRVVQDWSFFISTFDEEVETDVLKVQVSKMRAAFRRVDPDFDQLETIRGEGFRWRRADHFETSALMH
jgi:DNA-binding response OmpR family regulator